MTKQSVSVEDFRSAFRSDLRLPASVRELLETVSGFIERDEPVPTQEELGRILGRSRTWAQDTLRWAAMSGYLRPQRRIGPFGASYIMCLPTGSERAVDTTGIGLPAAVQSVAPSAFPTLQVASVRQRLDDLTALVEKDRAARSRKPTPAQHKAIVAAGVAKIKAAMDRASGPPETFVAREARLAKLEALAMRVHRSNARAAEDQSLLAFDRQLLRLHAQLALKGQTSPSEGALAAALESGVFAIRAGHERLQGGGYLRRRPGPHPRAPGVFEVLEPAP